jgi:hypothetical protein
LPLTVKQRLIELTASPMVAPGRGRCVDGEALRAIIGGAPAYADEIALFAARRLQERTPRGAEDDCSCQIELARAIAGALPDRSASLARLIGEQAPACSRLITKGIGDAAAGGGGTAVDGRTAGGETVARNKCAASGTCATPLLRPQSNLIGPTRLGGDS